MHPATLTLLLAAALDPLVPPPAPRGLLEFARTVILPDGPQAGEPYDPASDPAQFEILKAWAAGGHDEYVTVGIVQGGKSWATTVVPALYALAELRSSVVIGWPDVTLAERFWTLKLKPTITANPPVAALVLPTSGPGSDGGFAQAFVCPGGGTLAQLAPGRGNEAAGSSLTGRFVFIEERDDIGSRGVDQLFQRAAGYDAAARRSSNSTIKDDQQSATWAAYQASTRGRLWFPCPHCGAWQTFDWEHVTADWADEELAATTIRLVCTANGCRIDEDQRRNALRTWRLVGLGQHVDANGVVVGERPRSGRWGLWWSALDSTRRTLGVLARDYARALARRAAGDHDGMRQFMRDQLGRGYREEVEGQEGADQLSRDLLAARSIQGWADSGHDRDDGGLWSRHIAPLPPSFDFLGVTADVQENRVYWSLLAADAERRTWDVAWGYDYATHQRAPMSDGEQHAVLDRIDQLVDELAGDHGLAWRAVDVGYSQSEICAWLKGRPAWIAIAGAGDDVAGKLRSARRAGDLPGVLYRHRPEHWPLPSSRPLHTCDAGRVREQAQLQFLRSPGQPGAAHLPRGLKSNDSYIKHLLGEVLVEHPRTGRKVWKKNPGRHDYLDLRTYHLALLLWRLHQAARRSDADADPAADAVAQPAAPASEPWLGGPASGESWL